MNQSDYNTEFNYLIHVFTPNLPAEKTFVERGDINNKVVDALQIPGRQLIVYGMNYVGKTTLIERCLARCTENHIVTQCHLGMDFHAVLVNAFDSLERYYTSEKINAKSDGLGLNIKSEYIGIKTALDSYHRSEVTQRQERILPLQLSAQNLIKFLGESNCCWVLDDFHKIEKEKREAIIDIIKMFIDATPKFIETKMIIIGAVSTAEDLLPSTTELSNRISEVNVPLMTDLEIFEIMKKGEQLLNVQFAPAVKQFVVNISSGLPIICHELCLKICQAAEIRWTTDRLVMIGEEHFKSALKDFIESSIEDTKSRYFIATRDVRFKRYHHDQLIIDALSCSDKKGLTKKEILGKITESEPNYRIVYLKNHLRNLLNDEKGGLLKYDKITEKFQFEHPIKRAYSVANYFARKLKISLLV